MSETNTVSLLRQRMLEDMAARKLNPHSQRSHIYSCKRFAAWLKRSPDTATPDEVRLFQLYLVENGASICNRNRIMTGIRFLFRVTRHDLAAEVWHIKEPQKLPPVLSREEVKRILTLATSLKARAMLTLAYGCGPRAGEVVRLRAGDIDSARIVEDEQPGTERARRFDLNQSGRSSSGYQSPGHDVQSVCPMWPEELGLCELS
jgi:integrase